MWHYFRGMKLLLGFKFFAEIFFNYNKSFKSRATVAHFISLKEIAHFLTEFPVDIFCFKKDKNPLSSLKKCIFSLKT